MLSLIILFPLLPFLPPLPFSLFYPSSLSYPSPSSTLLLSYPSSLSYPSPLLPFQSALREHVQSLEEESARLKGKLEQAPSATQLTKMQKQISELVDTPHHFVGSHIP